MGKSKNNKNKTIRSFRDLRVYQSLYKTMVVVLTKIIPRLPREEKYDLVDQLRRCCKASPALLAEGFAKRYQRRNWRKYLDDTMGECNEMIHHLSVCLDVYHKYIDQELCEDLIKTYDVVNRQLYKLRESWQDFHKDD